ncbi:glycosyl transferase family group 2-domain-containing protein [Pseudomassariella vexata]|uniref:Glycosyl transferase family group 2-domain-containing protein n=1 Tax=Pseudomassariella vexata TaxID=1141098 RepID=A0A1Y2E2Y5_9PEZI|nr:glycosyl transferase family group 2-domain-containing protein [Pseudomassariella vexata]ORY65869.1 glycosyl transferase family group 2-domain-containing protein [Pseudomassariella vexata]
MSIFTWCTRRSGGLAMIATISLSYWVISKEAAASRFGYKYMQQDTLSAVSASSAGAGLWTVFFAYYCLLIHVLVAIFPLRACWSIFDITRSLKKTARNKALRDIKLSHRRRGSSTSLSSSETLTSSRDASTPSSISGSEAGDLEPEFYTDGDIDLDSRLIHAIVIPNYKEEVDTLRETLEVLASHPQARSTYDIYLAMEQREHNVELKAMNLIQEFVKKFRSIDFTLHPSDIPGESPGKGSNAAWAARKLSERYSIGMRKDVIITGIDADSHLSSNYFALLTSMHLAYPETATTTLYSAPIIFDRNAHNVPAIVRVADILWCAAGMSGLYSGSTIAPPTSVYSLPLQLVDRVGGWDCDSEAIGEDLHMYLKCFFALNGNLTVRTVLSPVSQSNVKGNGGNGIHGIYNDMHARYKQALRHMWGALDSGFAMRKTAELWQERKHTSRAFRPLHVTLNQPSDTYIPQVDGLNPEETLESGIFSDVTTDTLKEPNWERLFYLGHRLFEAHFLPVQTTILVVASTLYVWVTEGTADPHNVHWIFGICNILRTAGFMQIAFYLFLYESFHRINAANREREMNDAGLAKGMCFSHRNVKKNFIDYVMVPLVAPLYGSFPGAHAQISHFWTLDLVYTVSKKVTRQRAKSLSADTMA